MDDKPYDITAIPYFPFSPGLLIWLLVIIVAAAALIGPKLVHFFRNSRDTNLSSKTIRELDRIAKSTLLTNEAAGYAVRLVKRTLELLEKREFGSRSAGELEPELGAPGQEALSTLVGQLSALDSLTYSRDPSSSELQERIVSVRDALERYLTSRSKRSKGSV